MGTIAQELTRIQNAKAGLKTSIENKGVQVPANTLIDGYPALVDQISGGGGGNVFDNSNFYNLLASSSSNTNYPGRFLDYLDDIYNSSQTAELAKGLTFDYFASGVQTTNQQVQKIFNIVEKFAELDTTLSNHYFRGAFQYLSTTDNDNLLTFNPKITSAGSIYFTNLFYYLGYYNSSSMKFKLNVDFSNISNYNNLLLSDAFSCDGNKVELRIFNLPLNKLTGTSTLTFGQSTKPVKEITVRNGLTTASGTIVKTLNFQYVDMALDKWITLFNSFDSTTVSGATVKIPSAIYNQLSSSQIQIITDKGYALASA